jgi:CheY-like chemotaxis protein
MAFRLLSQELRAGGNSKTCSEICGKTVTFLETSPVRYAHMVERDILLNKSILLLDEDPDILAFLTVLFEERGLRVLRARSRREAMEVLERQYVSVDLILANIVITHLSDTDFEADVASLRESLPTLYMSAFTDAGVFRIEMMKRPYLTGDSGIAHGSSFARYPASGFPIMADEGVVNAVTAALTNRRTHAGAG